ncbi:MAG TPA: NAD(P)-dependent oxidoreductase [Frankiaceae bacterium]|jgi:nucleoside-diphosphate-sugar epimerase|nr:NAD(P)-dependent oxidoreductase [Frankiaceae bacterium]
MRVAITGARGRIGGAVARLLAGRGDGVVALARPALDLGDADGMATAFADCDAVVHCAGVHHDAVFTMSDLAVHEVNALGTARVCLAAAAAGVRQVVYLSSTAVTVLDEPQADLAGAYVRSKALAERLMPETFPGVVTVLRLGWVIDPEDEVACARLWPADGRQVIVGSLPVPLVGLADSARVVAACLDGVRAGRYDVVAGCPTQRELMDVVGVIAGDRLRVVDARSPGRLAALAGTGGPAPTWVAQSRPEAAYDWSSDGVALRPWRDVVTELVERWHA